VEAVGPVVDSKMGWIPRGPEEEEEEEKMSMLLMSMVQITQHTGASAKGLSAG